MESGNWPIIMESIAKRGMRRYKQEELKFFIRKKGNVTWWRPFLGGCKYMGPPMSHFIYAPVPPPLRFKHLNTAAQEASKVGKKTLKLVAYSKIQMLNASKFCVKWYVVFCIDWKCGDTSRKNWNLGKNRETRYRKTLTASCAQTAANSCTKNFAILKTPQSNAVSSLDQSADV